MWLLPGRYLKCEEPMSIQSKLALGLSCLIATAIAVLTLTPVPAPPLGAIAESDKIYHVIAFGVLVFPMAYLRPRWLMLAVPAYLAFGGLIEILQPFVGRDRSLGDWIADLIGLGIGVVGGLAAGRFVPFARLRRRR